MTSTISTSAGTLTYPNILILLSDQTRYPQHWPAGWVERNLPTMTRLMNHGLTFTRCFTAASECCPSRASFLTSTYPEENGVTTTAGYLTPNKLVNLANVLADAGYPTIWKGKFHIANPADYQPQNGAQYLFDSYQMQQWNPPDAGTGYGLDSGIGGGKYNNDGRIVNGVTTPVQGYGCSAVQFLQSNPPAPWCMVVSLVNPHDVLLYPNADWFPESGYPESALDDLGIWLPGNLWDDLTTKPSAQLAFSQSINSGPSAFSSQQEMVNYANFYAYLQTLADSLFSDVLAALDAGGMTGNTLIIRMADHGEMGLSHQMREKMYNAYEETIRMPFIVSNPTLWPAPKTTDALASTLDLVPTIGAIVGATNVSTLRGVSLLPVIEGRQASVQSDVVYTYDDQFQPLPPNGHIRCIRTERWKYAVYFSEPGDPNAPPAGMPPFEYELYDLQNDPVELNNLLYLPQGVTGWSNVVLQAWQLLHWRLTNQLEQFAAMPAGVDWPDAPWTS
jgi:arylsulfatase A-like enzyme